MVSVTFLKLIAACGRGGEIGADNALPWHLPADLRHFKEITLGSCVIMGRKTFASIGRALPGRRNIVISRRGAGDFYGCEQADDLAAAIQLVPAGQAAFIIGGGELYRQALPLVSELHVTEVDVSLPQADAFFPPLDEGEWACESRVQYTSDAAAAGAAVGGGAPAFAVARYRRSG